MPARPILLLALAASLAVTGVVAAEPPRETSKQQPAQVCRSATRTLGSHIRNQRRCRTEAQWKEEEESKSGLPIGAQVTTGQNDGQAGRQPQ
jgi:hypothetical protein